MIELTIKGKPLAKQSARFAAFDKSGNRKMHSYQKKYLKDYANNAKIQILAQLPTGFKMFEKPVSITYRFVYAYTSDISKKNREFGLFRYKRPDIDNLQKNINDILNDLVIADDALIVRIAATKEYADKARTILEIEEFDEILCI